MRPARSAWGFSFFCDDLREEVGGKISLMGMYDRDLFFQAQTPVVFPKFVILVRYFEIVGAFSDDLVLSVFLPGDEPDRPSISLTLNRPDAGALEPAMVFSDDAEPVLSISVPVLLSPWEVKCEGAVRVRMRCGEVVTRLGELQVSKGEPIVRPGI